MREVSISNNPDSLEWKWITVKNFSTKYYYKFLLDGGVRPPFGKVIWKLKISQKVKYFLYLSVQDKILMKINLAKRGWQGSINCPLCDSSLQTVDHLLLQCPFARKIWTILQTILRFNDLPHTQELLWNNREAEDTPAKCLDILLAKGLWCPWKERNKRCFQGYRILWGRLPCV